MGLSDIDSFSDLLITLETQLVVQPDSELDDYTDNYIRRYAGPISVVTEEDKQIKIGEIEVWYLDGSRALDNNLDIIDVCDSDSGDALDYAQAIYADGMIDNEIVPDPISNDVLVLHTLAILPEYRGLQYGLRVVRKIVETIGYRCGAAIFKPYPMQFSPRMENREWVEKMKMSAFGSDQAQALDQLISYWKNLDVRPTNDPSIFCLAGY